jgi:alkylhydroperoxidase/carboxymuconolactone decarboxylase family protein YurZ
MNLRALLLCLQAHASSVHLQLENLCMRSDQPDCLQLLLLEQLQHNQAQAAQLQLQQQQQMQQQQEQQAQLQQLHKTHRMLAAIAVVASDPQVHEGVQQLHAANLHLAKSALAGAHPQQLQQLVMLLAPMLAGVLQPDALLDPQRLFDSIAQVSSAQQGNGQHTS